jgi:hypothetical protein
MSMDLSRIFSAPMTIEWRLVGLHRDRANERLGAERMRRSGIALGLVVAMCAFGVVAAPALAFGKFYASIKGRMLSEAEPGIATGHGRVEALRIGPYKVTCEKLSNTSKVISEGPSESFFTRVTFSACYVPYEPLSAPVTPYRWTLPMEFLSKLSAKGDEGESEVRITEPVELRVVSGNDCPVVIPVQSLRLTQKPGAEYEAAVPETEEQLLKKPKQIEKFGEVRKRLAFAIDLKRLKSYIVFKRKCRYRESESEEGRFNPETGHVEFNKGIFEGGLREVTLKEGNLWFEEE